MCTSGSASPRADAGIGAVEYALLAVAVSLRLAWPFGSAPTHVDEGGWPLAVRLWAVDGLVTFDFYKAPLYHLVLGAVYTVAPPTMMTARLLSVVLSVVSLWLLFLVASRSFGEGRAACWAVLLWASCFPANDLAGRALIEPLQITFVLGLMAVLSSRGPRVTLLTALATAAVLLTKANAVVVLPALLLALWWDTSGAWHAERRAKVLGLAIGTALSAACFVGLWLWDPDTFRYAWSTTAARPDVETATGVFRLGRFVLDPRTVEHGLEFVASQTPFLFVVGVLGGLRALSMRHATAPALAFLLLFAFVLVQADQAAQYFALLYPMLALTAAAFLAAADERGNPRGWPKLALLLIVVEGLVRSAAAPLLLRAPERPAVAWLRAHTGGDERVLAAPYILMQLRNPGTSVFAMSTFSAPPDSGQLAAADVRWLVVDSLEWLSYVRQAGRDPARFAETLGACCEQVFDDGAVTVYRVRKHD